MAATITPSEVSPDSPRAYIRQALLQARSALDHLISNDPELESIERAASLLCETFDSGGRVFSRGNGGSMSDAMHFAEELTGRFRNDRAGLPAQAISDVGHLSCVANDFGYEQVFSKYVQSHGRLGDCLFAISTSGSSPNVLRAAAVAKEKGMIVVALTGRAKSALCDLADVAITTAAGSFADRVQERSSLSSRCCFSAKVRSWREPTWPSGVGTLYRGASNECTLEFLAGGKRFSCRPEG